MGRHRLLAAGGFLCGRHGSLLEEEPLMSVRHHSPRGVVVSPQTQIEAVRSSVPASSIERPSSYIPAFDFVPVDPTPSIQRCESNRWDSAKCAENYSQECKGS